MNAGRLRKLLHIEEPTTHRDADGQNVPTYTTVATVWGSIEPLHGNQLAQAQARSITATATTKLRIRYRPGLRIGYHRIRYGGTSSTTPGYSTLTAAEYGALTSTEYAPFEVGGIAGGEVTGGRYFAINDVQDPEERHRELVIMATELKA